jgi:hypothetical protein
MNTYYGLKGLIGVYADETFAAPGAPKLSLFKMDMKRNKDSDKFELLHRVRPYPDPTRPLQTEWLSKQQIQQESQKQSTNWMKAGSGDIGFLYVEILGCDDLFNTDLLKTTNLLDKTDCFVNLVHEDGVVNTDVIRDSLSPRWMPWSRRAFCFGVAHPQSNLFLGIFDHDMEKSPFKAVMRTVSKQHVPIGRCVVNLSMFLPETLYTLTYPIYYSETDRLRENPRGTIQLRLRIEWNSPRKALLRSVKPPPPIVVSCARKMHWQVAQYTVNGVYDDTHFSTTTIAHHISELQSYRKVLPHLQDFLLTVWLWRGHFRVKIPGQAAILLPLHSLTAFSWGLAISWDFNYIPSFLVFCIGWSFLAANEFACATPSPWHKRRGYFELWLSILFGSKFTASIEPNQNLNAAREFMKKEEQSEKRWALTQKLEARHEEDLKKEFGTLMDAAETAAGVGIDSIATKQGSPLEAVKYQPLKPILYPIQRKLRRAVLQLRVASSIFLWVHSYYAFWITSLSFVVCFVFLWIPWAFLFRWIVRIAVFVLLGPW